MAKSTGNAVSPSEVRELKRDLLRRERQVLELKRRINVLHARVKHLQEVNSKSADAVNRLFSELVTTKEDLALYLHDLTQVCKDGKGAIREIRKIRNGADKNRLWRERIPEYVKNTWSEDPISPAELLRPDIDFMDYDAKMQEW